MIKISKRIYFAYKYKFTLQNKSPIFTKTDDFLQFHIDIIVRHEEKIEIIGEISCDFLARWGQISDESEKELVLSVFNQNPKGLARIASEIYLEDSNKYKNLINEKPLVNITKRELLKRNMHVD